MYIHKNQSMSGTIFVYETILLKEMRKVTRQKIVQKSIRKWRNPEIKDIQFQKMHGLKNISATVVGSLGPAIEMCPNCSLL